MKRIAIYVIVLSILALCVVGCSSSKDNLETIILPVISLQNTGEKISPKLYEDGFDFNYDNLPILTLAEDEDILQIVLSEDFPNKIVIGEDYYKYTKNTGTVYKETYELEKDDNNVVLHPINRRGNVKDEQAIYYLSDGNNNNRMIFVFKVILPIDKID